MTEQPQNASIPKPVIRVLAIDLGDRRMGFALSDPLGLTAQGLPTAERRNRREDMNYIKSLVKKNGVGAILMGDPVNMDGSIGPRSQAARAFAARLQDHVGVEVLLRDERLTSVEATRILRETGGDTSRSGGSVDQVAAMLLLQEYLDAQRAEPRRVVGA
jgi:putative Holliday junction resolvase